MDSSVLNEACAIFSRSDSLCILMTLTERLLPDGGRQKPLESERDKDLPPPLRHAPYHGDLYQYLTSELAHRNKLISSLSEGVMDLYQIPQTMQQCLRILGKLGHA